MGGQQTRPTTLITDGPIQVPDESFQIFNNIQDSPVNQTPDVPFNHSDTMDEKFRKVCHEWRRKMDILTERVAQIEKDVAQTYRTITVRLDNLNQDCVSLDNQMQELNLKLTELRADTSAFMNVTDRFNKLYGTIGAQNTNITILKKRIDKLESSVTGSAANAPETPVEAKQYLKTHITAQTAVCKLKKYTGDQLITGSDLTKFLIKIGYLKRTKNGRAIRLEISDTVPDNLVMYRNSSESDRQMYISLSFFERIIVPRFIEDAKRGKEEDEIAMVRNRTHFRGMV